MVDVTRGVVLMENNAEWRVVLVGVEGKGREGSGSKNFFFLNCTPPLRNMVRNIS